MKLQERDCCIYVPKNQGAILLELGRKWSVVLLVDKAMRRVRERVKTSDLRPYRSVDGCFSCRKTEQDEPPDLPPEEMTARALKFAKDMFGQEPPERRRMCFCRECARKILEEDRTTPYCNCPAAWGYSLVCTCEYRRAQPIPDFLRPR